MNRPKAPQQLIGSELVGCRVVAEIGRGGMAHVYRAYQTRLDRWVAIKVLRVDLLSNPEVLARFRREAKAVAALRHPNILTIHDYGEEHGLAYIIMEYVAGGTLKERLTGQPWEAQQALSMVIPMGRALTYAHTQGIIHRDVKPANILLAQKDWPLLSDFGLAKLLQARQHITEPGMGLGTPLYTAPEQMTGEAVDHRADIYALAMVLYELVTGRLPFGGHTPVNAMVERLSQPPVPPRRINPALSPQLEAILIQALSRQPQDRYAEMEEMVSALDQLFRAAPQGQSAGQPQITQSLRRDELTLGARLIISGTNAPIPLPSKQALIIGRSDPFNAQVPDVDLAPHGAVNAGVSRVHARLLHKAAQWQLEDLNSTNGTYVNGQVVPPNQVVTLQDGDAIQFGNMHVTFYSV